MAVNEPIPRAQPEGKVVYVAIIPWQPVNNYYIILLLEAMQDDASRHGYAFNT